MYVQQHQNYLMTRRIESNVPGLCAHLYIYISWPTSITITPTPLSRGKNAHAHHFVGATVSYCTTRLVDNFKFSRGKRKHASSDVRLKMKRTFYGNGVRTRKPSEQRSANRRANGRECVVTGIGLLVSVWSPSCHRAFLVIERVLTRLSRAMPL